MSRRTSPSRAPTTHRGRSPRTTTIAFAEISIGDRPFEELAAIGTDIRDYGDALAEEEPVEGLVVEYGGDLFAEFELPESEIYGVLAAVIILILAFGSVLAMGLPIGIALFGLGVGTIDS